jgi:hypothetical protein
MAGADKIVETDSKDILVTSNGVDLLGALCPQSGILSLILKSVEGFVSQNGDGSKRLLLQITKGLDEV